MACVDHEQFQLYNIAYLICRRPAANFSQFCKKNELSDIPWHLSAHTEVVFSQRVHRVLCL